jgi:hypothetical protein
LDFFRSRFDWFLVCFGFENKKTLFGFTSLNPEESSSFTMPSQDEEIGANESSFFKMSKREEYEVSLVLEVEAGKADKFVMTE